MMDMGNGGRPVLSRPHKSLLPQVPQNKEPRLKIVSAGDMGVGKSCLIKRYCEERFVAKYVSTIGVDYGVKSVGIAMKDGSNIDAKVNFWDLAGHTSFFEVRNEFYKHTQGIILVYSVASRKSFTALSGWIQEASNFGAVIPNVAAGANGNAPGANGNANANAAAGGAAGAGSASGAGGEGISSTGADAVVVVICANKIDAGKRAVPEEEGRSWAESHGYLYFETSASTGDGVVTMFETLFAKILEKSRKYL